MKQDTKQVWMPVVIGAIFLGLMGIFGEIGRNKEIKGWREQHASLAESVGLNYTTIVPPDNVSAPFRYTFSDPDSYFRFPPDGVFVFYRGKDYYLAWKSGKNAFWSSNPGADVISPATDRVIIMDRSESRPDKIEKYLVNTPHIIVRIISSDPKAHVCRLKLSNLNLAIVVESDSGDSFYYQERRITDWEIGVLINGK